MREFVCEALEGIPGIENSLLCIEGCSAGDAPERGAFRLCESCPNFDNGTYILRREECLYRQEGTYYVIPMKTVRKLYGFFVIKVRDKGLFQEFEPAVHNFANTVAMKIENAEHQKRLKEQVLQRTAELNTANEELSKRAEEKELLLREIHHRVKNNLNVVISLLQMQFGDFEDQNIQEALQVSMDRIRSMALVHQYLYQSEDQNSIDFKTFVEEFIRDISVTYETGGYIGIQAHVETPPVHIDSAIPVSLMINELITNAIKYAFPEGEKGTVTVDIRESTPGFIELRVSDDGVGLPEGFIIEDAETLGMKLLQGLTEQIEGKLALSGEDGTVCTIVFPLHRGGDE